MIKPNYTTQIQLQKKHMLSNVYVFFMIIILYVFNFQTSTGGNKLTNIIIVGFILLEIYNSKYKVMIFRKYIIPLISFALLGVLSYIYSPVPSQTLVRSKTIFLNILFMWSLLTYMKRNGLKNILLSLQYGGLSAAIYSILNSNFHLGERTSNIIGNANTAGIYLTFTAIISFYMILENKTKILNITILFIIIFSILITGSRTALILLSVGTLSLYLIKSIRNKINIIEICKSIFLISIVGMIVIYIIFHNKNLYSILGVRIESLFQILSGQQSSINEGSTTERIEMIKLGWSLFLKKPIIGIGLGGIGYYIKIFLTGYYTFCHNNFIEILSGLGVLGFILYYSLHIKLFKKIYANKHELINFGTKDLAVVLLILILISHFFIVHYYYKFEFLYLALLIAIIEYNCKIK